MPIYDIVKYGHFDNSFKHMHIAVSSHYQIDQKQCSNKDNHVQIMEFTYCLNRLLLENPQDGRRFVCMTLRGKTLRPGMNNFSVVLLTSTLLAEMDEFAS